ncbi:TPA: hypothetical protein IAC10_00265 [Candidatus Scatousia excrementigallinarum]|uniref:Uncharacterized protein n=1 Tax=Candidatus Scatousia excrementigallinarum TaxID=2840935 RepID=A0A9D1EW39_9BACT|nr:hypothetical protein [Candidatus Scatousia excrementigallinarum]
MPIAPISNTLTRNYNVGFTSLKIHNDKKNSENHSSGSFMKAVPLAAMIAMSPLNVTNVNAADRIDESHNIELVETQGVDEVEQTQRKVVALKEFPYTDGKRFIVKLINTTGGEGFDRIELARIGKDGTLYDNNSVNTFIKAINKYNISVISDDGVNQGTFPHTVLDQRKIMRQRFPIFERYDEMSDYILEQLANNPKENVIPVNEYNMKIAPTLGGAFQNNAKPVNINDVKGLTIDRAEYEKNAPSRVINGENDTYTIRFYKSKSDGRNLVTCEKSTNPGNEFRVSMAGDFTGQFGAKTYRKTIASYKLVGLNNDDDGFGIMDTTLGKELQKIAQTPEGARAYICPAYDYIYDVLGKGVLANVTDDM